jgi:integrase
MVRKNLTDRYLKSLKPAPNGRPYEVMDSVIRQTGVRVMGTTASPVLTFILIARFPPSTNPTRRALGAYVESPKGASDRTVDELLALDVLTLAEARLKAQEWLRMIARGLDPAIETERRKQGRIRQQKNTFLAVFEDWVREKLPGERKGKVVERDVRREFVLKLGSLPITEITDLDVLTIINAKKRTAPVQARNELGHIKRFLKWAVGQRVYGLKMSPCDSLKPGTIIGEKKSGNRILNDAELFALWRAVKRLPYPYKQAYQILVLTALRLNEVADASWPEFDLANQLWVVPAVRMKAKNSKARPHAVPLTDDILAILTKLPRFKRGHFLFSTTFGEKPIWMNDKIKKRVDARMLRTLRALARQRGIDPAKVEFPAWTNHDIRRTVRSNLSRLRVTEEAREAVLAHVRPGIKGTYDHHDYLDEKREALEFWNRRLFAIVEPQLPSANVIELAAVRA